MTAKKTKAKRRAAPVARGKRIGGDLMCDPNLNIVTGKSEEKKAHAMMMALPFIKDRKRKDGGGRCFWEVKATGDYIQDYEQGMTWARQMLPMFQYNVGQTVLSWIVLDMIKAGVEEKDKGLVLGFMREIGRMLSVAVVNGARMGGQP